MKLSYILIVGLLLFASCSKSGITEPKASTPDVSAISVSQTGNADGRTVLFIPGLASSADVWSPFVEALAQDHDVRVVQVAGFAGAAPQADTDIIIDRVVEDLADYLKAEAGRNTLVVGHSIGGLMAMKLAASQPDVVDELLIVDTVPFLAGLFIPGATPEMMVTQGPMLAAQMKSMPHDAYLVQQKAGLARLTNTAEFLLVLETWAEASDQASVATAFGEAVATDFRAELENIQQPTTVIVPWDEASPFGREQALELYANQYAGLSGAEMVMIPDSYHFVMIDQKEAFEAVLRDVLVD